MLGIFFLTGLLLNDSKKDTVFYLCTESFVKEAANVKNLDQVFDSETATVIREMGSPRYATRELMTKIIRSKPPGIYVRAIYYGSRHKDAEIAGRCRYILEELAVCPHCDGKTKCPLATVYKPCIVCFDGRNYVKNCMVCDQVGHLANIFGRQFKDERSE